jgi:hypothetical protein
MQGAREGMQGARELVAHLVTRRYQRVVVNKYI